MPEPARHSVDAQAFRAVVENLREIYGDRALLLVDPRPMKIPEHGSFPGMADYHDGVETVMAGRLAVLAELGVDTASALPLKPNCHPLMSAPPARRIVHGCPEDETIVALFDTVQVGSEPATWTLRELPVYYRPDAGRSALLTDNVVGRARGAWVVLERRPSWIFEH